jgi:hypothetical protein
MMTCSICGDGGDARGLSGVRLMSVKRLGLACVCERCGHDAVAAQPLTAQDKKDRAKVRRNQKARARYQAMRDLGMIKTPYGWE